MYRTLQVLMVLQNMGESLISFEEHLTTIFISGSSTDLIAVGRLLNRVDHHSGVRASSGSTSATDA